MDHLKYCSQVNYHGVFTLQSVKDLWGIFLSVEDLN